MRNGSQSSESFLSLVNAQGFLLQLRVEELIRTTERSHGWRILGREHLWIDPRSNEERYADLILGSRVVRLVLECKRVRGGQWIFLIPSNEKDQTQQPRLLWFYSLEAHQHPFGWSDFWYRPAFYKSAFCIVRGQGENDRPMLETLASTLVRAVETISLQEFRLLMKAKDEVPRVHIPVIVTTAELVLCRFDPKDISLDMGALVESPSPAAQFESVPYLVFQKPLSSDMPPVDSTIADLEQANLEGQRSVFVVQASHLVDFLKVAFPVDTPAIWPWAKLGIGR